MPSSRSSAMDDLVEQTLWDGFWLPDWAHTVDRPELRYTHSEHDHHGLHHISRIRDEDARGQRVSLPALVDEVDRAHRGRHSTWMLAPRSQLDALPPLLRAAGWRPGDLHHLRTLPVGAVYRPTGAHLHVQPVCDATTLIDCIRTNEQAFGRTPGPLTSDRLDDELGAIQRGRVHRFVARERRTGAPMASGGLNTFPQLGIGFLWGGGTHPDHRGCGAYRALVSARLERAAREGCRHVAVYARHDTSDPILERLGFQRHGTMQTWMRAPA